MWNCVKVMRARVCMCLCACVRIHVCVHVCVHGMCAVSMRALCEGGGGEGRMTSGGGTVACVVTIVWYGYNELFPVSVHTCDVCQ